MRKYKDFIGPRDKHGRVLSYQARTNKEEIRTRAKEYAPKRRKINQEIKLLILAYYGPNKELCCSWKDCNVIDPDMLTRLIVA